MVEDKPLRIQYSILDATNDFADLSNNIGKFKIKLCKDFNIPYSIEDVKIITPLDDSRFITLDSIQQNLLSLMGYIRGFMELQRRINYTSEFLRVLNLGVTEEQMERIIYKFPIESLVTMTHFQIDSYFGQLCELENDPKIGFYNRMIKVLENIPEKENFQNNLQCLANIRNSFHNIGIHLINKNKWEKNIEPQKGTLDRIFESGEFKIEFKHMEVINYNWKSLFLLINKSVEILMEIIYVKSKKEVISNSS